MQRRSKCISFTVKEAEGPWEHDGGKTNQKTTDSHMMTIEPSFSRFAFGTQPIPCVGSVFLRHVNKMSRKSECGVVSRGRWRRGRWRRGRNFLPLLHASTSPAPLQKPRCPDLAIHCPSAKCKFFFLPCYCLRFSLSRRLPPLHRTGSTLTSSLLAAASVASLRPTSFNITATSQSS
jgi:hypothetical protein